MYPLGRSPKDKIFSPFAFIDAGGADILKRRLPAIHNRAGD